MRHYGHHNTIKVNMTTSEFLKISEEKDKSGLKSRHGKWICTDGILSCNCYDSPRFSRSVSSTDVVYDE